MYYSYVEKEYIATSFSPARMDLALKLLMKFRYQSKTIRGTNYYKRYEFFYTYYSSVHLA
jgi:hypothetical protein